MKRIDHRYEAVQEAVRTKKPPTDPLMHALYLRLIDRPCDAAVARAYDVYVHEFKREVLEAFLLVDATVDEIQSILRVQPDVTKAYSHLFFDTTTFVDELDRMDYTYEYDTSSFGKELKRYAVDMGKECLKIRISRGAYTSPSTVVQDGIRSTAYVMAQLVKINPPDSTLANSALRWATVGLKAAEANPEKDTSTVEDLRMALTTREEAVNQTTSGIAPDEIIH